MLLIPVTDHTIDLETDNMSAIENSNIEDIKKCISSMDSIEKIGAHKENPIDSNQTDEKSQNQPDNGIICNDILKESGELNGLQTKNIKNEEPQTENTNVEQDNKSNGLINYSDDSSEKETKSQDVDSSNVVCDENEADEQSNKELGDTQTTEDIVIKAEKNNTHNYENVCVDKELLNANVNNDSGKSIENENSNKTSQEDISIENKLAEMFVEDLISCEENNIVNVDKNVDPESELAKKNAGQERIKGYREEVDVNQRFGENSDCKDKTTHGLDVVTVPEDKTQTHEHASLPNNDVKESVDEVSTNKRSQETTASVFDTPAIELEDKAGKSNDSGFDKTLLNRDQDAVSDEKETTLMIEKIAENMDKVENPTSAEVEKVIPVNETNDKPAINTPINVVDDMNVKEVIKVAESSEHTKPAQVEDDVAVNEPSDKPTTSTPIDLIDDMDMKEVIEVTKNRNNTQPAQVEDVIAVNKTNDKPTKSTPIDIIDDMDIQEVSGNTENSNNTKPAQDVIPVNKISDKPRISTPINVTNSVNVAVVIQDIENCNNTKQAQVKGVVAVNKPSDKATTSIPIDLIDAMDIEEVIGDTKNSNYTQPAQVEGVIAVNETSDKPTTSTPFDETDGIEVADVIENTENDTNTKPAQVEDIVAINKASDKSTISTPIDETSGIDVAEVIEDTENSKNSEPTQVEDVIPVKETNEKPTMSIPIDVTDDMDVEEVIENTDIPEKNKEIKFSVREKSPDTSDQPTQPIELKDDVEVQEIVDDNVKICDNSENKVENKQEVPQVTNNTITNDATICKLSNNLDILSDDEETPEPPKQEPKVEENDKQCINLIDDDDIMMVDEDTNKTVEVSSKEEKIEVPVDTKTDDNPSQDADELFAKKDEKESSAVTDSTAELNINEKIPESIKHDTAKPLLPKSFLKSAKKNIADMSREDLEEFCILKIVESIIDRSNLSEIKNKLKTVEVSLEETKKKAAMITKQNRDLQVVLKSVQEEQKKNAPNAPVTPLKITRSVGMQVFMEVTNARRKGPAGNNQNTNTNKPVRNVQVANQSPQRPQKSANTQFIPVPRLVPASSPAVRAPTPIAPTPPKTAVVIPNGVKTPSPAVKAGEKRPHNKSMSETVDLTDDEPPAKVNNRNTGNVRLVSPQHLMPPQRQPFGTNSPRKVYIPISGQNQNMRPGAQAIMLKTVPTGFRPRGPISQVRVTTPINRQQNSRPPPNRHPAPLPDSAKQYQPPNWKNLPPAPDLKLSKVENGIVISWKIEGYQEDNHEEIASYQLYAYQETTSPPCTSLWKKIGDVKALPLPMACTLTQFMAGFKYYFAVRAVDIRSRLGPFSLPGSILLLNKF